MSEVLEVNNIYNMKDIELLEKIEQASVDALITDPPYFINIKGMMNTKKNFWDSVDSLDVLVKDAVKNIYHLERHFMKQYETSDISKINLSKRDRIYVYFYVYFYNIVESWVLKEGATLIVFNTYENCQMMEEILNELCNDFGFRFYDFAFLEYTKYNPHSKASIEKTSEYLIHVKFSYKRDAVEHYRLTSSRHYTSKRMLNSSDVFTLRDKEIYDAINITKGYYVPKNEQNKGKRIHDTQKPPRLLQYLISNFTNEGDTVLDTFSGSGSIAMSCYELNRKFIACEMLTENYEMSIERLEYFKKNMPLKIFTNDLVDSHFELTKAQFIANERYDLGR